MVWIIQKIFCNTVLLKKVEVMASYYQQSISRIVFTKMFFFSSINYMNHNILSYFELFNIKLLLYKRLYAVCSINIQTKMITENFIMLLVMLN